MPERQGRAVGGAIHQHFQFVDRWQPPGIPRVFVAKFGHRCQCFAPEHRLRREVRAAAPKQVAETIQHASAKDFEAWLGPRGAVTKFAVLTGAGAWNDFAGSVKAQALAGARDNTQTFAAYR